MALPSQPQSWEAQAKGEGTPLGSLCGFVSWLLPCPSSGTWTTTSSPPRPRGLGQVASLNLRLHLYKGTQYSLPKAAAQQVLGAGRGDVLSALGRPSPEQLGLECGQPDGRTAGHPANPGVPHKLCRPRSGEGACSSVPLHPGSWPWTTPWATCTSSPSACPSSLLPHPSGKFRLADPPLLRVPTPSHRWESSL